MDESGRLAGRSGTAATSLKPSPTADAAFTTARIRSAPISPMTTARQSKNPRHKFSPASCLNSTLHMPFEVVQNGLPPLSLLLNGMRVFPIKFHFDMDA